MCQRDRQDRQDLDLGREASSESPSIEHVTCLHPLSRRSCAVRLLPSSYCTITIHPARSHGD